ncbi:hypothetical protein ACFLTM_01335 [Candidatus Bipolaricaulota bacterium]
MNTSSLLAAIAVMCAALLLLMLTIRQPGDETGALGYAQQPEEQLARGELDSPPCDRSECVPAPRFDCTFSLEQGSLVIRCAATESQPGCGWITSYEWRFGDGGGGEGVEILHVTESLSPVPDVVELTVRNSYGCTARMAAAFDSPLEAHAVSYAPQLSFIGLSLLALLVAVVVWLLATN